MPEVHVYLYPFPQLWLTKFFPLKRNADLWKRQQWRIQLQIDKIAIVRKCAFGRISSLLELLQIRQAVTVRVTIGNLVEVSEVLKLPRVGQPITIRISPSD